MRIMFVIASLADAGGAERVLSIMANYWAEKGKEVIVVSFADSGIKSFYQLSSQVKRVPLKIMGVNSKGLMKLVNNYKLIKSLRRIVVDEKPDAVISFLTNTNIATLLATLKSDVPVIVSERNHPAYVYIDPLRERLRKWLYPKASFVVCQTKGILEYLNPYLKENGVVVPNPVIMQKRNEVQQELDLPEGNLLIAAGGMTKQKFFQKGFDLLLSSFSEIAMQYRNWHLIILGDGPEKAKIEKMVRNLSLENRVYLPGNVEDINAVFVKGDLFVLTSRYEGFPNALCEAMACGLPAVSFDCPTGPGEIIRDEIDGKLVPGEDEESLKLALKDLMSNNDKRKKMGNKAKEITQRYSIDKIMEQWEALFGSRV